MHSLAYRRFRASRTITLDLKRFSVFCKRFAAHNFHFNHKPQWMSRGSGFRNNSPTISWTVTLEETRIFDDCRLQLNYNQIHDEKWLITDARTQFPKRIEWCALVTSRPRISHIIINYSRLAFRTRVYRHPDVGRETVCPTHAFHVIDLRVFPSKLPGNSFCFCASSEIPRWKNSPMTHAVLIVRLVWKGLFIFDWIAPPNCLVRLAPGFMMLILKAIVLLTPKRINNRTRTRFSGVLQTWAHGIMIVVS